ncbi:AbrB/MazE/SpoVT family DNA-binding domain-containing protein [Endozoicomonas arenosclerae]|uniref:AbrB/MazE/SpoVT family DNA-binding domain-containing protein n=1 Tax=Endozoicomonas arenosclerae TaxID=1633495 RepID=UPI00078187F6|nr:AbrB/MazE/SpoVT family DNA-binding domain-containing protein [Endozoicomonas arenosclerae]
MTIAKLTSKGQITIPAKVRADLNLNEGDQLEFIKQDDGSWQIAPKNLSIMSLCGVIKTDISLSDDEIKACISEGFSGKDDNDDQDKRMAI